MYIRMRGCGKVERVGGGIAVSVLPGGISWDKHELATKIKFVINTS